VLDASDHARHAEAAERGRPVGNGQAGVVRGDQSAGNDQKESRKRDESRVARQPPVWPYAQLHLVLGARASRPLRLRLLCPHLEELGSTLSVARWGVSPAPLAVALSSFRIETCAADRRQGQAAEDRRSERSDSISP